MFKLYLCAQFRSYSPCLWMCRANKDAVAVHEHISLGPVQRAWHIIMCKMTVGRLPFGSMALSGVLDQILSRSKVWRLCVCVCVCFSGEGAGFRVNWLKQENRTWSDCFVFHLFRRLLLRCASWSKQKDNSWFYLWKRTSKSLSQHSWLSNLHTHDQTQSFYKPHDLALVGSLNEDPVSTK